MLRDRSGDYTVCYYADGRLYSEKGQCLGTFGISPPADKVGRSSVFFTGFGTLRDSKEQILPYYGSECRLGESAGKPVVIVIGPPPRSVSVLIEKKQTVITSSSSHCDHRIPDDQGYERRWHARGKIAGGILACA